MQRSVLRLAGMFALGAGMFCIPGLAKAGSYSVAYTDGGTWNTVYAQGFNTAMIDEGVAPSPAPNPGDTVNLNAFSFYKSGNADSASNIQLVITNTMYPNLTGLTTSSSSVVGVSTTTLASTSSIPTGAPETFSFNNLPLVYGSDYAAIFANIDGSGNITPVLVSALTANYALQSDNNYHPVTNYGTETQYNYTTSDFINSGFFSAFSYAGDSSFTASLSTVPEPATLGLLGIGSAALLFRRRRA
jgi:hypothetical protein